MATTRIYESRDAFWHRPEDRQDENGISAAFLMERYHGDMAEVIADGETNMACWDCWGCSQCLDCTGCLRCRQCRDCHRSADCMNCAGSEDCRDCRLCGDCKGLEHGRGKRGIDIPRTANKGTTT